MITLIVGLIIGALLHKYHSNIQHTIVSLIILAMKGAFVGLAVYGLFALAIR